MESFLTFSLTNGAQPFRKEDWLYLRHLSRCWISPLSCCLQSPPQFRPHRFHLAHRHGPWPVSLLSPQLPSRLVCRSDHVTPVLPAWGWPSPLSWGKASTLTGSIRAHFPRPSTASPPPALSLHAFPLLQPERPPRWSSEAAARLPLQGLRTHVLCLRTRGSVWLLPPPVSFPGVSSSSCMTPLPWHSYPFLLCFPLQNSYNLTSYIFTSIST